MGDTFFQTTMTHVINFFVSFPVVKQEHVEGNPGCIGFPHLFIGFPSVFGLEPPGVNLDGLSDPL